MIIQIGQLLKPLPAKRVGLSETDPSLLIQLVLSLVQACFTDNNGDGTLGIGRLN